MKNKSFLQKLSRTLSSSSANKFYSSLVCIAIGLFIGFVVMLCLQPTIAGTNFLQLITGGLIDFGLEGLGNIFATTAPLLCCGVAIIFAYKSGLFNIGVAGQYTFGAFGALIFAIRYDCHWTVCILMAFIFGALWGVIPALLKSFCHVNEVISGIMLNWVALFFVNYSMQTYLSDIVDSSNNFQTFSLAGKSAKLPNMGASSLGDCFSIAILIAIAIAIIIFVILQKTTFGYQLKASGYNHNATKYAGINARKNLLLTMGISGGIAGIGAALYYLSGIECWNALQSSALSAVPWNGIIVAFLAQMNPIGAIFGSGFLALISSGATATSQSFFPKEISDLITALIVYLSGLTAIIIRFIPWIKTKLKKNKGDPPETPLNVQKEGGK